MKKIFTLISMAFVAMSVNAQTESYTAVDADGNISTEFSSIIGENNKATNVADGKSVVTISTTNVTCEAVGGAVPANVASSGAQQITPGTALPDYVDQKGTAHPYAYEVASVNAWGDITWEHKNNSDPINVNGDNINIIMGSGNPYVKLLCEEIVTEGDHTGTYKALYEYYIPGMDMPKVGLYYKFTTKVDGALKVQVWANKGSRNTFLINGQTKEQMDILAEGYINGQKATDEAGEKIKTAAGKEVLKFFTADEIKARHNDAKVKDGVDTAPYVIADGGQAFWGNVIIDAKAGVDYWLFQDSSQIGFGGFTFAPGKSKEEMVTGVEAVKNVAAKQTNSPIYNLAGQKVSNDFKGVVIQNGAKRIQK